MRNAYKIFNGNSIGRDSCLWFFLAYLTTISPLTQFIYRLEMQDVHRDVTSSGLSLF